MFSQLEGDTAILSSGGVYRQTDLYHLNGDLFAKMGAGFVRLNADGSTSKPKMALVSMATNRTLFKDRFGRLAVKRQEGYRPLVETEATKLLALPPS